MPRGGERTICTGHIAPVTDTQIIAAVGDAPGITWSSWRDVDLRAATAVNATLRAGDARAIADDGAPGHQWDLYIGSATENPGEVDDALLDATHARWCVITEGAHGGRAWTADDGWRRYDPIAVPSLADTCDAGDSFNASVLMGIASGDDIPDACARGGAVAAQCLAQIESFALHCAEGRT